MSDACSGFRKLGLIVQIFWMHWSATSGCSGMRKKVYHDAGGIQAQGLFDRIARSHAAEEGAGQLGALRHWRHPCGGRGPTSPCRAEIANSEIIADGKLDGVGRGGHEGLHALLEVFDSLQKITFVEEAMIHGDIEAAVGFGVKKSIQTVTFHRFWLKDLNLYNHFQWLASMLKFMAVANGINKAMRAELGVLRSNLLRVTDPRSVAPGGSIRTPGRYIVNLKSKHRVKT